MGAERLEDVEVSWHGLAGDRRWAFVREGLARSAFPWLTIRERPDMGHHRAWFLEPGRPDASRTMVRWSRLAAGPARSCGGRGCRRPRRAGLVAAASAVAAAVPSAIGEAGVKGAVERGVEGVVEAAVEHVAEAAATEGVAA
jgi:hypothetical protein